MPQAFPASVQKIMIFILHFANVMYYTGSLVHFEPSLYPRGKYHAMLVYDPFIVVSTCVYYNFVEDFGIYSRK